MGRYKERIVTFEIGFIKERSMNTGKNDRIHVILV